MSDRFGFAYGHYHPPIRYTEADDPARVAFLNELAALRKSGQRYQPTPIQSQNYASPRNEVYAGLSSAVSAVPILCKVCGKPVPVNRRMMCSPECRAENNRRRQEKWHQRALKAAVAAVASGQPLRECKVCAGPIPLSENGRKVRIDTETCSPNCRRLEYNRARRERKAQKRAARAVAK